MLSPARGRMFWLTEDATGVCRFDGRSVACPVVRRVEFQLELDFAAIARVGVKFEAPQQRTRWPVSPQCPRGEKLNAVVACALHRGCDECGADAHVLQLVGDLDGEFCDLRSISDLHIAADPDDRAVALIDRGECRVADVIDIGEGRPLTGRQFALG